MKREVWCQARLAYGAYRTERLSDGRLARELAGGHVRGIAGPHGADAGFIQRLLAAHERSQAAAALVELQALVADQLSQLDGPVTVEGAAGMLARFEDIAGGVRYWLESASGRWD